MKEPYEINLKDGNLPSIVINAPAVEVAPKKWTLRLRWAWRCLRGQPIDVVPSVSIINNHFEIEDKPGAAGITVQPPLES